VELKDIIGFLAGFGTTFAAMPDLIAMLRRRSSEGMNPRMAAIMGSFQVLWVYYGLMIGSYSVVMWNVIAICVNALTVGAYLYFSRAEKRERTAASPRQWCRKVLSDGRGDRNFRFNGINRQKRNTKARESQLVV